MNKLSMSLVLVALFLLICSAIKIFNKTRVAFNYKNNLSSISKVCKSDSSALFNVEELSVDGLKNKNVVLNIYDIRDFSYIYSIGIAEKLGNDYKNKFVVIDVVLDGDANFNRNTIINYIIENGIQRPVIKVPYDDIKKNFHFEGRKAFVLINQNGAIKDIIFGDRLNKNDVFKSVEKNIVNQSPITCKIENIKLESEKNPEYFVKSLNRIKYVNKNNLSNFAVSDSEARKIYILNPKGEIVEEIGNGRKNLSDGVGISAAFCYPFGISLYKNEMYIADTCNSAIRMLDLKTNEVSTILQDDKLMENPVDLEFFDDDLFILNFGSKNLIKYNLNEKKSSLITCDRCDGKSTKLVKYDNKLYFANEKKNEILSINKDGEIEVFANFDELNIEIKGSNNFYIDETGVYIIDKYKKQFLHIADGKTEIIDLSEHENFPNDVVGIRDKIYVTNSNDILEIDKNTKYVRKIPISFSYGFRSNDIYDDFLNINNIQKIKISTESDENKIVINLNHDYILDRRSPQSISIFIEDKKNNEAVLIKEYTKKDILSGNLKLPEFTHKKNYYIIAKLSYRNKDSNSSYMINNFKRKIVPSKKVNNTNLVIDFLY